MDYIVDRVKTETDLPCNRLLTEARLHSDDVVHIPLHNQMLAWAAEGKRWS